MKSPKSVLALILAGVLVLTGCVKVDADLEVSADSTVSGTIIMGLQKSLGPTAEDLEDMATDMPPGMERKPWEDEEYIGSQYTFEDLYFDSINELEIVQFSREGDVIVVSSEANEMAGAPSGAEIKIAITFPGKVLEANGKISGRTVTWSSLDVPPSARAEASSSSLPYILIAVAVLLVLGAGVAGFLLIKKRGGFSTQPAGLWDAGLTPNRPTDSGRDGGSEDVGLDRDSGGTAGPF